MKCLTIVDEFTHECLAVDVAGSIRSARVIEVLIVLVSVHGAPRYLRSDNGPEFIATALLAWLATGAIDTAFIAPGKPWQNGTDESFNGKFRDECLSLEWFRNRAEAKVAIEPSAISLRPSTKPPSQRGARRLRRLALTRKNTDTTDLQPAPFSSNHWSEEPRHIKAPRSRPPYGNFARKDPFRLGRSSDVFRPASTPGCRAGRAAHARHRRGPSARRRRRGRGSA